MLGLRLIVSSVPDQRRMWELQCLEAFFTTVLEPFVRFFTGGEDEEAEQETNRSTGHVTRDSSRQVVAEGGLHLDSSPKGTLVSPAFSPAGEGTKR